MSAFAEFFAGIGLVREAIAPLGWRCVFANDISPTKAEMYARRFGSTDLVVDDVANIRANDLPTGLELITASFPCIDLSLAGNRRGLAGEHSGTVWPFLNLVGEYCSLRKPPSAILLENVTGLLTSNRGWDLHAILEALNALGYSTDLVVINARWFVPQSRPRLFIIAISDTDNKNGRLPAPEITRLRPLAVRRFQMQHSELRHIELPIPSPPRRSPKFLVDILDEISEDSDIWWTAGQASALLKEMNPLHRKRVKELSLLNQSGVAAMYRRVRNGKTVGEIRGDGIAGCLRTPQGGSSIQFLIDARSGRIRIRPLTAREYARLQGASKFPISGFPDRQAMLGFGDAVCVPAVRWLAKHSFGDLSGYTASKRRPTQLRISERKPAYA